MTFNHKLYGKARLIKNRSFLVSAEPIAINYVLLGFDSIQSSGIHDAGLIVSDETLIEYGYKFSMNLENFNN